MTFGATSPIVYGSGLNPLNGTTTDIPWFKDLHALSAYESVAAPTWVFDVDRHALWWGNRAALTFWGASSIDVLRQRDFSTDSSIVRERLKTTFEISRRRHQSIREMWTLHPCGRTENVQLEMRAVLIDDGRRAHLLEIKNSGDLSGDPTGLRLLEAARLMRLMVRTFSFEGALLAQNTAAVLRYGHAREDAPSRPRGLPSDAFAQIISAVREDRAFSDDFEIDVDGRRRTHRVLARRGRDPITGEYVVVICEQDITDRVELSQRIESLNSELEARVQQRTRDLEKAVVELKEENVKRRRAQEALREQLELLDSLVGAIPAPVFYKDADGALLGSNHAFAEFMGVRREDVVGKTITDLAPGPIAELCRTTDAEVLAATGTINYDFKIQSEDGSTVEIVAYKSTFGRAGHARPGIVSVMIDVTEQTRAQAELRASAQRVADIAEIASDWFWELDAELRFIYVSKRYRVAVGADPEALLGRRLEEIYPESATSDPEAWAEYFQAVEYHRDFSGLVLEIVERGQRRIVSSTAKAIFNEAGEFAGYRGASTDVTDRAEAEDRLRQAQKMESVGQLTGGIAHDFNNLLAVIQGCAEIMLDDARNDRELVRSILSASMRGAKLTDRLLAYARQQALRSKSVDLYALARSMQELLQRTLGETIEVQLQRQEGLWNAIADPGRVEDALLNLAINARDAMPRGGRLTISCANVGPDDAEADQEIAPGHYAVIEVSDDGIGMSAEVAARAFEPFFTTKDVGQGTGLGLSTVYGFAKQSGGHASIRSTVGHGTTVRVYLPRDEVNLPSQSTSGSDGTPTGEGETILVIEDDHLVRGVAVRMACALGYLATSASTAAEAKALLEASRFDLILSDVVLPGGLSGPKLAQDIRAQVPGQKIVFMSGYAPESTFGHESVWENEHIIAKPFGRKQLAQAIHRALHQP